MITSQDIIDAINSLILTKYPECTFYIEEIPSGFEQPSFYIQMLTDSYEHANKSTTFETPSFQIVYFGNVDQHHLTSMNERLEAYRTVKSLFRPGYIMVNGEAIKLASGGFRGEIRKNEVFFTLDFEYFELKTENGETYPLATEVNIKEKEA